MQLKVKIWPKTSMLLQGTAPKQAILIPSANPLQYLVPAIAVHVQATDNHIGTIRYFGIL
jgi:hypothetical protein